MIDVSNNRLGNADLPLDDLAAVCLLVRRDCLFICNNNIYIAVARSINKYIIMMMDQVYFGVTSLVDASSGDGLKAEEEQKEAELAVSEVSGGGGGAAGIAAAASTVLSTFALVFVAEWGDKSFFSTIGM